jgi:putative spermidine/putrescine transport system permease protein
VSVGATLPTDLEPASPTPARTRRAVRHPGARTERRWLLWPPLLFFVLTLAIPIGALFVRAFSGEGNAFAEAITMPVFLSALWRTLLMALVVTVLSVLTGACYALAIAVSPAWLKAFLMVGLLLSLWTSIMVRTFGWMLLELPKGALYWFLNLLGLADEPIELYQTTPAMYPAMLAVLLPFAVLPVLAAVTSLDREQLNAATVSGAGPLLTFRAVILPAISHAVISAAVLVFVMSLGFYVTPLLLGGPSNMTLSGIIDAQLNTSNRADIGAAMSILLVGGTVGTYLVADRLFRVSERWG